MPPGADSSAAEDPDSPDAAWLAAIDREIEELQHRAIAARQAAADADARLQAARWRREALGRDARFHNAQRGAAKPATALPPTSSVSSGAPALPPPPVGAPPEGAGLGRPGPEASPRTVQNLLFVLGGVLLGLAAIVFTAVAWTEFGVMGRAEVLGGVTVVALSLPIVALGRRLRATAETFAALALLLVGLDGVAAWAVNLGGVAALPGRQYTGIVLTIVGVVGYGYRRLARLTGTALVALLVVQPVPVLLDAHLQLTSFTALVAVTAVVDVIVARRLRSDILAAIAWSLVVVAALIGLAVGGLDLAFTTAPGAAAWAALALLANAAVLIPAARASRERGLLDVTVALTVFTFAAGLSRVGLLVLPSQTIAVPAAVAAVIAAAVAGLAPVVPPVARGLRTGSVAASGVVGLVVAIITLRVAVIEMARALPALSTVDAVRSATTAHWSLPAAVVAVTAALVLAAPGPVRGAVWVSGTGVLLVDLPGSLSLAGLPTAMVGILGAGITLAVALLSRNRITTTVAALTAGGLLGFAVVTSLAAPALTAEVLALTVLFGVGANTGFARAGGTRPDSRSIVADCALVVALVAFPPAIGSALVAWHAPHGWPAPAIAFAAVAAAGAVAIFRRTERAAYGGALITAAAWPNLASNSDHGSHPAAYAGLSLLAVAVAYATQRGGASRRQAGQSVASGATVAVAADGTTAVGAAGTASVAANGTAGAAIAAIPGEIALAIGALPSVVDVIGSPYSWLGAIWTGPPTGVGLATMGHPTPTFDAAVGLALLAVAVAVLRYTTTRRIGSALTGLSVGGPTALLVGLAAVGAAWPALPAASLLVGVIVMIATATRPTQTTHTTILVGQAALYIGSGLAGSLGVKWTTLAALGVTMVAGAVIGTASPSTRWRVAGWFGAVAALITGAVAAGYATDLVTREVAFPVLGAAIVALAGATAMHRHAGRSRSERRIEGQVLEGAAHAGAVVALMFTIGWSDYASAICVIWGVVVSLVALVPTVTEAHRARARRVGLAAVAGGFELLAWWLLLDSHHVTVIEAYTLPLALVALLAGFAARRARQQLTSWVAYAPSLLAAFGPSLAGILTTAGEPWRRLALGAGALVVVVLGARARLQASVVIGGLVLLTVATHELVLLGQHLPGWIYLAAGGIILVGLAITYERRLRDLDRLRTALRRMT
jgi:hypothetical protein